MKKMKQLILLSSLIMSSILLNVDSFGQTQDQIVRIAKIKVAADQLKPYQAALKEGIETAVRMESGVLPNMLYRTKTTRLT
jgi:4-carboxymuconolactone decarboxylase